MTPDGRTAWVTTGCDGFVVPVDLASRTVGAGVGLPGGVNAPCPEGLAVTSDGRTVYATDGYSGAGLTPIDVATRTRRDTIYLQDSGSRRVVLTPDGRKAYVDSGDVTVVDLRRGTAVGSLSDEPLGPFAMHPSGRSLLIAHDAGGLGVVDTRTDEVRPAFLAPLQVADVVVAPDQAPVAGFHAQVGPGRTAAFDASSSVGVTSPVATYAWRFGDGTRRTTTTPSSSTRTPARARTGRASRSPTATAPRPGGCGAATCSCATARRGPRPHAPSTCPDGRPGPGVGALPTR